MQEYFNVATNPTLNSNIPLENNSNYFIYKNFFPKLTIEQIREGEFEKIINENTELFFTFSHYYNIICSLIKFNNLPGKYAKNLIMRILVQYGSCAICKKDDEFYIAPFFNKNAKFNESGEPVSIQLQEYTLFNLGRLSILNKQNEPLIFSNTPEKKEFCIIDSTPSNLPLFYVIYYYSLKLVDVQSAIDNNIFAMQQPIIYRGIAEHKMDLQQLYEKFINKVRAFFILKRQGVSENEIEVLDLKVKNYIETFENHKDYVKKEFFEFFGINAVPYEKKERMLVDEVNSNNMLLELVQAAYFNTIKNSIEKCNETLGTDIKIEFNINGFLGSNKGGEENDEYNEIV
ncbi:MAG: hypothetical protein IKG27_05745 [Bacilli bacterium]|nr:hypothetical protein [Bacilli bacterium]